MLLATPKRQYWHCWYKRRSQNRATFLVDDILYIYMIVRKILATVAAELWRSDSFVGLDDQILDSNDKDDYCFNVTRRCKKSNIRRPKFRYVLELKNVSKFHQLLRRGLIMIMGQTTLVCDFWYDPTHHQFWLFMI